MNNTIFVKCDVKKSHDINDEEEWNDNMIM